MKTWKKTSLVVALVAALGLGTSAVMARGGQCGGYGGGKGYPGMSAQTPERIKERVQLRLARLELALAIKPEQKGAWEQFSKAALTRADQMTRNMAEMQKAGQPKTALERLDRMEKMAQVHQRMVSETRGSVEALYNTLSDAQRTVFDAEWAEGGPGAGLMRHGGHRGGYYGPFGDGSGRGSRGQGPAPDDGVI